MKASIVVTAIATAIVAVGAYAYYRCYQPRKRLTLEQYLKGEQKASPTAKRQHTILHLIANLGLTEDEIIHASFRSKHISRVTRTNRATGLAETLLSFSFFGEERRAEATPLHDPPQLKPSPV